MRGPADAQVLCRRTSGRVGRTSSSTNLRVWPRRSLASSWTTRCLWDRCRRMLLAETSSVVHCKACIGISAPAMSFSTRRMHVRAASDPSDICQRCSKARCRVATSCGSPLAFALRLRAAAGRNGAQPLSAHLFAAGSNAVRGKRDCTRTHHASCPRVSSSASPHHPPCTGSPSCFHLRKPPSRSEAPSTPSSFSAAAASDDAYPSLHICVIRSDHRPAARCKAAPCQDVDEL